jgi:DNA-binding transcriptional ArsR family regulator
MKVASLKKENSYESLKTAALVLRAVNHPLRQQILSLIRKEQQMTVTTIYRTMKLEQSVASQHLAILRKVGAVKTRRDGKNIYYSVNEPAYCADHWRLRAIGSGWE